MAAREGGTVVVVGHWNPALSVLTGDVGMTGVALRIDGVVFLIQALVGGLSRIDRAAHAALQNFAHRPPLFLLNR
jgi:hypothetical protein